MSCRRPIAAISHRLVGILVRSLRDDRLSHQSVISAGYHPGDASHTPLTNVKLESSEGTVGRGKLTLDR